MANSPPRVRVVQIATPVFCKDRRHGSGVGKAGDTYLPEEKQQSQNQTAHEMMSRLSFQVTTEADSKSRTRSEPEESTLDTGRIVAELKRERDRLSRAIAVLDGQSPRSAARMSAVPRRATRTKRKGDRLTPAGRKRLSQLMKKRWAERRKKGSKA
jgi:hypothetical protein